jgi:type I restriction enzyme S subunit
MALTVPVAEIVASSKNSLLGKDPSWERVRLGDIAEIQNGFPFKSAQFSKNAGVPLIRIRDVGADTTDTNYIGDYDRAYLVQPGDLLIGMDGDFNCARWRGPEGLLNQRVCRVILKSHVYLPKLLDYALPGYLKAINDMTSSVTVKHLSSKSIADIPLPLPPFEQQQQMVAEIEKQFSRLDEAVANLNRIKANLKRYKAAVLKAAVEGRLVETEAELARHEGRQPQTGRDLLSELLSATTHNSRKRGQRSDPDELHRHDSSVPEGWATCSLDQLTALDRPCAYGVLQPGDDLPSGVPFVRVGDIGDGRIAIGSLKNIDPTIAARYPRTQLEGGEVLVTLVGAIGRTALVPEALRGANVARAVAVVPITKSVDARWVEIWLRSPAKFSEMNQAAHEVARKTLNLEDVRRLRVLIPPLPEQARIADAVEELVSIADQQESHIDDALRRARLLHQAVLASAFSPGATPR